MESVWTAVKSTFRKRSVQFGKTLRRWSLKTLRNALDRADEWIHAQEVGLREQACPESRRMAGNSEYAAEVDPIASAARERLVKKFGGVSAGKSITGSSASPHSRVLGPYRLPRLKYQRGEFIRSEAR